MKTITFRSHIGRIHLDGQDLIVDKYSKKELKDIINNIECQENFVDYLDCLTDKLYDGYMTFNIYPDVFLPGCYVFTKYNVRECLTDLEIEYLKKYTQGQWSDGIGENFEQEPCGYIEGKPLYISPWFYGQQITTIIE